LKTRLVVAAWLFFGCDRAPYEMPVPAPSVSRSLAADIAQLNADYLSCMRRENERLREEKAALDRKINTAVEEAAALASAPPRRPTRR